MSNKAKNTSISTIIHSKVIYDRKAELRKIKPRFKPGNTSHYQFGNEILNANIAWQDVIKSILASGDFNLETLCTYLKGKKTIFINILEKNDASLLDFKMGAKLLSVQTSIYPERY